MVSIFFFSCMMQNGGRGEITRPALSYLAYTKHNQLQLVPLTEDLVLLWEFLIKEIADLTPKVKSVATKENWRQLGVDGHVQQEKRSDIM